MRIKKDAPHIAWGVVAWADQFPVRQTGLGLAVGDDGAGWPRLVF